MKRLLPVILVCLLGGGAGAVAAAMWVNSATEVEARAAGGAHAAADSNAVTASDSTAREVSDSGHAAITDSAVVTTAHPTADAVSPDAGPSPAAAAGSATAQVPDTAADGRLRRLGKLFGQMQAKDAARVLVAMTDADVAAILAHVPDRAASKILAALPPQQAAAVAAWTMPASVVPTPRP